MGLVNRRALLLARILPSACLIGLAAFGPARATWAAAVAGDDRDLGGDIARIFRNAKDPRSIGRCYLATYPEEAAGARRLAEELRREQGRLPGREGVRRALADWRRQDLEDGMVVVVGGWVLARTEARACALTVL